MFKFILYTVCISTKNSIARRKEITNKPDIHSRVILFFFKKKKHFFVSCGKQEYGRVRVFEIGAIVLGASQPL